MAAITPEDISDVRYYTEDRWRAPTAPIGRFRRMT